MHLELQRAAGREMPFEEIAPIIGRSTGAARQLASRARPAVRPQLHKASPPRLSV